MLCSGLEGRLFRNAVELKEIGQYLRERSQKTPSRPFDWSRFVRAVFSLAKLETEDDVLDEKQWYCLPCILAFVKSRFRRWWIAKKIEGLSRAHILTISVDSLHREYTF